MFLRLFRLAVLALEAWERHVQRLTQRRTGPQPARSESSSRQYETTQFDRAPTKTKAMSSSVINALERFEDIQVESQTRYRGFQCDRLLGQGRSPEEFL